MPQGRSLLPGGGLGLVLDYYYVTGRTQKIYEDHLVSRGIDPKSAPAIVRELWNKA